jgi:arginine deiminase
MHTISRRAVLGGMAGVAATSLWPFRAEAAPLGGATLLGGRAAPDTATMAAGSAPGSSPFLSSDVGTLRRVLVHSVSPHDVILDRLGDSLLPDADSDMEALTRQHQALMVRLREAGTEVVELEAALETAIDATRASGVFATWVRTAFPSLGDPARVTAATILGRHPSVRYQLGPDGSYRHLADDSNSTIFTRDSAVMTPQGLLLCRAVSQRRRRENMLLRFVYAHSPLLARYPVVFDAIEEGLIIEGGDAIVVDAQTLLLGVGNRTDPRIAPALARRLDMDVLAVRTLKRDFLTTSVPLRPVKLRELRLLLLHLDTFFTLVAPRHALAVPYLLEKEHAETSPLARFIRGARAETLLDEDDAAGALEMLKVFGTVTLFHRGSGREEDLGGVKLVDHLRTLGYGFTFVGGPPPSGDAEAFRHFMSVTYPELRRQGCNVVQARPGRVIAYAGNARTQAALEADGIGVDTFEARELWAWHGGPHCLTQPLERV